jgi:hypothetical protein
MRCTIRIVLLCVALVAVALPAPGSEPFLDGMYTAEGTNADGTQYRTFVKITPHGQSVLLAWIVPKEDESGDYVLRSGGVGVVSGGMLAVSYYGQDVTGVVLYQIENGGQRLAGRWVVAGGDGAVHSEIQTKLPTAAPESDTQPPARTPWPPRAVRPRTAIE